VRGTTLYSCEVTDPKEDDANYAEIAKRLLDQDINIMCVNRASESHTALRLLLPESGDRVIYAARRRMSWVELMQ
jgi:hypothetical protein